MFIFTGLLAACLLGLSVAIRKLLFTHTEITSQPYTFLESSVHTLIGAILVLGTGTMFITSIQNTLILVFAGFLYGLALLVYYYAIEKDEAGRVSQLASLEVVVTPLLALVLLQESLTINSIIGTVFIISSVLLLTIDRQSISLVKKQFIFGLLLLALILWAVEDVLLKFVLEFETVIFAYFWLRLAATVSIFLVNKKQQVQTNTYWSYITNPKLGGLILLNGSLVGVSLLLVIYTYSLVELSIAAPLTGSYPIFVLVWILLLHRVGYTLPTHKNLPVRFLSALVFILGLSILL